MYGILKNTMTNLFKRNKTYYIRLSLNDNLKIYFGNKTEYVKSLNTNNINNARLIAILPQNVKTTFSKSLFS